MEAQYQQPTQIFTQPIILKQKDLMHLLGGSRTTLYRLRQHPDFPVQKMINGIPLGWDAAKFYEWLNSACNAR